MHAGTILFNGTDLSRVGKPRLTIRRQSDPPAPALPTRSLVTLAVTVALEALDPGTIQARLRYLQETVRVGEGILSSTTGSGHSLEWLATPSGDNLAEALTGKTNEVELTFSAVENHGEAAIAALPAATYTPAGGGAVIHLHALRELAHEIRTEHHGDRIKARKLTTTTRSIVARVYQANPADPANARLTSLMAKVDAVNALNTREGVLTIGGISAIVRIQEFSPQIEGNAIDLRIQCTSTALPNSDKAEVALETRTRRDEGTGENVISLSGTIDAESRALALAKLNAIRTNATTAARRNTTFETTDRSIDGEDTGRAAGDDWTGSMSFTMEFREAISGSHYTLKIATSRDIRSGMRWTYTGTVKAVDTATALTVARTVGGAAAHPIRTRSDESVDYATDLSTSPTAKFVQVGFTYEYEGPSDGFIGGEIRADESRPLTGEWRRNLSGTLTATSRAIATTRLNALMIAEGVNLEPVLRWTEVYLDETGSDTTPKQVFQRLEFSGSHQITRTYASTQYEDTQTTDEAQMLVTRVVSGTIYTDTKPNAQLALTALIASLFGADKPQKITSGTTHREWAAGTTKSSTAGNSQFGAQLTFQMERVSAVTGATGYDIIEASFTLQRIGCINLPVVTPIPFARPVAQPGTGYLPGTMRLQTRCKARTLSAGRTWCQGKRTLVTSLGTVGTNLFETSPPDEGATPEYAPFGSTTATVWNFSGSYGWTFISSALDGNWGAGLLA